jgi:hypothetical protein
LSRCPKRAGRKIWGARPSLLVRFDSKTLPCTSRSKLLVMGFLSTRSVRFECGHRRIRRKSLRFVRRVLWYRVLSGIRNDMATQQPPRFLKRLMKRALRIGLHIFGKKVERGRKTAKNWVGSRAIDFESSTRMTPSKGRPHVPHSFLQRRNGSRKTRPGGCPDSEEVSPKVRLEAATVVREWIRHGGRS